MSPCLSLLLLSLFLLLRYCYFSIILFFPHLIQFQFINALLPEPPPPFLLLRTRVVLLNGNKGIGERLSRILPLAFFTMLFALYLFLSLLIYFLYVMTLRTYIHIIHIIFFSLLKQTLRRFGLRGKKSQTKRGCHFPT